MPTCDYRCGTCNRKSSRFVRFVSAKVEAVCPYCGSGDVCRVISPVSFKVSSTSPKIDYYKDPANIGKHVEETFSRHGLDLPESVHKTMEEARRGKMPKRLDL